MPQAPTPAQPAPSSAAENAAALRGEPADPSQPLDRYEQSQIRFRTVFENSPLGQKIITPDLTIRQANAGSPAADDGPRPPLECLLVSVSLFGPP